MTWEELFNTEKPFVVADLVVYPVTGTPYFIYESYSGMYHEIKRSVYSGVVTLPYDYFDEPNQIGIKGSDYSALRTYPIAPLVQPFVTITPKQTCTCDFHTVLLRYGCQCGGE